MGTQQPGQFVMKKKRQKRTKKRIEAEEMNNIKSGCVNGIWWMCTIVYESEYSHTKQKKKKYNREPTETTAHRTTKKTSNT